MSFGNDVTVVGSVSDPELKFVSTGKAVTNFSVRVPGGKGREPHYFDVVCWEGLAENVAATFNKGDRAIVNGRLEQQKWEQDGNKRSRVQITASSVGADLTYASAELTRSERTEPSAGVADF